MRRFIILLVSMAIGLSTSQFSNAQPPYPISYEDLMRIRQYLMQNFAYGSPFQRPQYFRMASVDQQFIPAKKDIIESVYGPKSVRQSFAATLPTGNIESIAVYIKQAPLGSNYAHTLALELFEAFPNSGGAPKSIVLASATAKATNTSAVPQIQWISFKLNKPVKSWQNRQLVFMLSSSASPGVFNWVGDSGNPYPRGQGAIGIGFRTPTGIDYGFKVINVR